MDVRVDLNNQARHTIVSVFRVKRKPNNLQTNKKQ
jgi:hypothetical protein